MNASATDSVIERPWRTYLKAVIFILPAVAAWGLARDRLLPTAKLICEQARFDPAQLGWFWHTTRFLAEWGLGLLAAGVLGVLVVEWVAPRWWHRRLALGVGVWLANLAVLFALCVLLVLALIAASEL